MRKLRLSLPVAFVLVGVLVAGFATGPLAAQNDCSGRCFLDPNDPYASPYCGLSAFGHRICVENPTYCVEFACPGFTGGVQPPTVKKAPVQSLAAPAPVQVVKLKARV
jgi:hypothetical protein